MTDRFRLRAYMNEIRRMSSKEDALHAFETNVRTAASSDPSALASYCDSFAEIMRERAELALAIQYSLLAAVAGAADLYETEFRQASQLKALRTAASLSLQLQEYTTAATLFERAATVAMKEELTAFGAKIWLFHAIVCTLASGALAEAEATLARAQALDYRFKGSREGDFCESVVAMKRLGDAATIEATIREFVKIAPQNEWVMAALRSITQRG